MERMSRLQAKRVDSFEGRFEHKAARSKEAINATQEQMGREGVKRSEAMQRNEKNTDGIEKRLRDLEINQRGEGRRQKRQELGEDPLKRVALGMAAPARRPLGPHQAVAL